MLVDYSISFKSLISCNSSIRAYFPWLIIKHWHRGFAINYSLVIGNSQGSIAIAPVILLSVYAILNALQPPNEWPTAVILPKVRSGFSNNSSTLAGIVIKFNNAWYYSFLHSRWAPLTFLYFSSLFVKKMYK